MNKELPDLKDFTAKEVTDLVYRAAKARANLTHDRDAELTLALWAEAAGFNGLADALRHELPELRWTVISTLYLFVDPVWVKLVKEKRDIGMSSHEIYDPAMHDLLRPPPMVNND